MPFERFDRPSQLRRDRAPVCAENRKAHVEAIGKDWRQCGGTAERLTAESAARLTGRTLKIWRLGMASRAQAPLWRRR